MTSSNTKFPKYDFQNIFQSLPELYMLLDLDFCIIDISDAYANATLIKRENVVGQNLFEVFPDNPEDQSADGVKQLRSSLKQVLNYKRTSTMALQKYDITKPDGSGFEVRYWSPRNSPVFNSNGDLVCIVHTAEDVTDFVYLKQQRVEQSEQTDEMTERISKMESEVITRAKEVIEKNEALLNSEQNLSITLSSIGDAVLATDEHGIINRLNPVAESLIGWTAKEAIGKNVNEVLQLVYASSGLPKSIPIFEVISNGTVKGSSQDGILIHRYGRKINISDTCSPIRNKNGEIIGSILVFRDISEEFAAKTYLEKAKENAEMANKAKDSFLATMSHEIRTPLSGLIGMLELLYQTSLNDDQKSLVNNALVSGNSLLRILSDILDLSKIEEGKLELSLQPTSISRLLSEVATTYLQIASSKGLTLSYAVDEKITSAHILDSLRLSQIINNFVSNGIKFTSKGSIHISANLIKNIDTLQQIQFSVTDTGIGLSKTDQSKLFQSYTQATADTARLYGGTGLGLAICMRLSELMDGNITIDSLPGSGSTFSITLSLPTTEMDTKNENSKENAPKTIEPIFFTEFDPPRILAVDDNSVNLEIILRQLKVFGLEVDGADDGEKALQLWLNNKYDLIITDCHMPIKDGYTLTKEIRNIEKSKFEKRIPIIGYTANALVEEREYCLSIGMDELLIKPARLSNLRETLVKWLPNQIQSIDQ
ncbi:Sensor and regulator protein of a two component response regulator [Leptospira biflexa serovar Patoc strain 'Patoc 1 (Ames)']|uniref:Sensory/regulatory protein RpfC n=1 Tax=Leptospira biflexa serovar Patoc (strain Patoc 1 / ATCC 23582 / Paris) TaxID=456481 RepID=B0SK10_LEPBP|nr:ATP-binding protein [Leptospira biflexa]ABZ92954.1 Sensor and regulator protein of a two component response regulator [Leptospira biflexa serovar Patoc strain 'Patoc 1 (Ames)']ABZ96566.1 Putative two-component sensor protein [Leptospira biflexa serovar Patoc strain 'Patoc 1 (Paris)']